MVNENDWMQLIAPDNCIFTSINFASYGTPNGDCGAFSTGWCHAGSSMMITQNACLGKNNCSIGADNGTFGDPCYETFKRYFVEAEYSEIADLNLHYSWSTGDTTSTTSVTPQQSEWYYCYTTINGMAYVDSIFVVVNNTPPSAATAIDGPLNVIPGSNQISYTTSPINDATSYNWILSGDISGTSTSDSLHVNIGNSFTTGSITVMGANACGTGDAITINLNNQTEFKTLTIAMLLEGLYNADMPGTLKKAKGYDVDFNIVDQYPGDVADKVDIELHNSFNPYDLVYLFSNVDLYTNGTVIVTDIPYTISDSYFLVIKHRNSIQTWSASPIDFSGDGPFYYDFIHSADNTFGNNVKDMMDGYYAIYAGDVDQDGGISIIDMGLVDNEAAAFGGGYIPEDIDGDGGISIIDLGLIDNNAAAFVGYIFPGAKKKVVKHNSMMK